MIPHPARTVSLYAPSDTRTADDYRLGHYKKLSPSSGDAEANQLARLQTLASQQKLTRIRGFEENWDGYGSAKPSADAIANAEARLPELYRLSTLRGLWREPHVSAGEGGEVSFEWWSGSRKVTMYFSDHAVELIKVWGLNIYSEMELQELPTLDGFPAVWTWLYGN